MHEWALAEAVIAAAAREGESRRLERIHGIQVRLGELQQIDREIFDFALRGILEQEGPRLRGARARIEIEKATMRCRICAREWGLEETAGALGEQETEAIHFIPEMAHVYSRCPSCASPDFEVIRGRGVWLDSLEGE